ncbi:MAG: hypothetical protein D6695_01210 [Planctomycetota bacterium]|nr:MAG: hypothetical protein D6695_01210 [Planctomycetota bacterium]
MSDGIRHHALPQRNTPRDPIPAAGFQ